MGSIVFVGRLQPLILRAKMHNYCHTIPVFVRHDIRYITAPDLFRSGHCELALKQIRQAYMLSMRSFIFRPGLLTATQLQLFHQTSDKKRLIGMSLWVSICVRVFASARPRLWFQSRRISPANLTCSGSTHYAVCTNSDSCCQSRPKALAG